MKAYPDGLFASEDEEYAEFSQFWTWHVDHYSGEPFFSKTYMRTMWDEYKFRLRLHRE